MKGKSLLLVDDEIDLLETLKMRFELKGFKVLTASSGNEAFKVFQGNHVDAIVTDVRMPDGSGIDLLKKVKSANAHTPVVTFITAHSDLDNREAYDIGVDGLFSKPFNFDELHKQIQNLLTPRLERWSSAEGFENQHCIVGNFESIDPLKNGNSFAVGRGGASMVTTENLKILNEKISFNITLTDPPLQVEGAGTLRWKEEAGVDQRRKCGIEFERIDDQSRSTLVEWIEEKSPLSFIPKLD